MLCWPVTVSSQTAAPPAPAPTAAAQAPAVVITFDGSGSMWGKIPGDPQPRFYLARDAVTRALAGLPGATRGALVSFGHRRRGDCTDAAVVAPLAPIAEGSVAAGVEKLNPIGKGPLVLGLEKAAEVLDGHAGPKAIVLIHDDADNCNRDACEAVQKITTSQPGLRIHVVTLLPKPEETPRLACISRLSGGQAFGAQDAASLDAQIRAAITLAATAPVPARPRTQPPAAAAAPQPAVPTGPPGITAQLLLAPGGPPVTQGVRWRVLSGDGGASKPLAEASTATLSRDLPPGTYRIEARVGTLTATAAATVTAERRTAQDVVLDAAEVNLTAVTRAGRPPLTGALLSIAHRAAPAAPGQTVWTGYAGTARHLLTPGSYTFTAQFGLAREERRLDVKAGQQTAVEFELPVGELDLAIAPPADEAETETAPYRFVVEQADVEAASGLRTVAVSTDAQPMFALPAGTYRITARHGVLVASEDIAVPAGERISRKIALPSARLSIRVDDRQLPKHGLAVVHRAERVEPLQPPLSVSLRPDRRHLLPPGRYRLFAHIGPHNARIESELTLAAGADQTVTLTPASGSARLRLAQRGGAGEPFWEVSDEGGRVVMRSVESEPVAILAAGTYDVSVDHGEVRVTSRFKLQAGTDIDVTLEGR